MKLNFNLALALCVMSAGAKAQALDQQGRPLSAVPNARTAIAIADAVLSGIYGADAVREEHPFHAKLEHGEWHVQGTLRCAPNCLGGTMFIAIARKDGRVITVFHTK